MCDSADCLETLVTILNIYIPEILSSVDNYVVKGGRASDYYISKQTGIKLLRLTDWDIACKNTEDQTIIKQKIIEYLNKVKISNIKILKIRTNDGKPGIQLGINCNGSTCFFVDIVVYSNDTVIFENIQKYNGINYINYNYMLNDLDLTFKDRIKNFAEWLNNYGITGIDTINLTSNINTYLDTVKQQLLQRLTDKLKHDIDEIDNDNELTEKEKNEDKDEIYNKTEESKIQLYTTILPSLKSKLEKLIRTDDRLKSFKKGGQKSIKKRGRKNTKVRRNKTKVRKPRKKMISRKNYK
jgi:hypothetical protein